MRVYRVEHKEYRHGPYIVPRTGLPHEVWFPLISLADSLCWAHNDSMHLPPRDIRYNQICGFESLHDLLYWFSDFLDDLTDNGYIVAEYETENYNFDNDQVTFDKESAIRLTSSPI